MSYPPPVFGFGDEAAMRAFAAERAFAHVFCPTSEGPMIAHTPIAGAMAGLRATGRADMADLMEHL